MFLVHPKGEKPGAVSEPLLREFSRPELVSMAGVSCKENIYNQGTDRPSGSLRVAHTCIMIFCCGSPS